MDLQNTKTFELNRGTGPGTRGRPRARPASAPARGRGRPPGDPRLPARAGARVRLAGVRARRQAPPVGGRWLGRDVLDCRHQIGKALADARARFDHEVLTIHERSVNGLGHRELGLLMVTAGFAIGVLTDLIVTYGGG